MKKKPKQKSLLQLKSNFWGNKFPIAIAHRGGDGAGFGKRNTLPAFRSAYKMGYWLLETDVINTKDGVVIVAHGAKTRLTARLRGTFSFSLLQNLTYPEIKRTLRVSGEPIPTLEELLKSFPEAKFLIDPKTDEVVESLADLLISLKALERVCVASFHYDRIKHMHEILDDKVRLGLVIGRNNWLKYLPLLKTGRLKHIEVIYLHHSFVSRPMIRLIHGKGFKVLVWTANSKLSINHAAKSGADGIISDKVGLLKEILESRN